MLIMDERWSDDVLKYHGMESVTIRPIYFSVVNSRFLREAITAFPDLKLISCTYDPEVCLFIVIYILKMLFLKLFIIL